jgi:BMFP domain-containing protein YqiC
MSTDRLTEIVNYLSAISREIGEFRAEVNARLSGVEARLSGVEARLERVERELRLQGRRLDRIEGLVLTTRSELSDLEDRVVALESKQA